MMKKEYSTPCMQQLTLHLQAMLAASAGKIPIDPDEPGTPASQEKGEGFWEYEWE